MIVGIGTDIVEVARIEAIHVRYGEAFARRVLAEDEWDDYRGAQLPGRFLAKRFAIKEAFAKAAGTGFRMPVLVGNIAVTHDILGRPGLAFAPALSDWLAARRIARWHVSVSDERNLASAIVVLEDA